MEKGLNEEKEFNEGFCQEIANLLEICDKAKTDSITITLEYTNAILEIDMTFRAKTKEEEIDEN